MMTKALTLSNLRRRNLEQAGRQAVADGDADRLILCIEEHMQLSRETVFQDACDDSELSDARYLKPPTDPRQEIES